jgi:putative ABC transport system permease protein
MIRGRFIDAVDVRYGERHAVISRALSRLQGWEVGRTVRLEDIPFTIVGIVDAEGSAMQSENVSETLRLGERTVFVPRTAMGAGSDPNAARDEVSAILVRAPAGADLATHVAAAGRVLSAGGGGAGDYAWITPDTILRGVRRLQAAIGWTVGSVAALCLILGGTTLMSLMVANVRDRVTEIGLRRALGARPADIARLFVLEGCLITGAAAVIGISATHAVLWAGGGRLPVPLRLDWVTVAVPLLFSAGIGGLFSYWPARLAAHISPADALRAE